MNQTFIELQLENFTKFLNNPKDDSAVFVVGADLLQSLTTEQVARFNGLLSVARHRSFTVELADNEYHVTPPENFTVYDGNKPDARYEAALEQVSVFRPRYRKLEGHEMELHDAIKNKAQELYDLFEQCSPSTFTVGEPIGGNMNNSVESKDPKKARYVALGKTSLEEAVMWAVKGLTA